MTFAAPTGLPDGSWRATATLASGITTATATAAVQFSAIAAAQAGPPGMRWTWAALGGLALLLAAVMARYVLRHRRQVPA